MALSLCSSAIETTFPLSNFKTKHIFGILKARVKFLKPFGEPQASENSGATGGPIFFFYRCRRRRKLPPRVGRPWLLKYGAPIAPQFCFSSFTAAIGGGFPNGRSPRGRGKSGRRLVFRELYLFIDITLVKLCIFLCMCIYTL